MRSLRKGRVCSRQLKCCIILGVSPGSSPERQQLAAAEELAPDAIEGVLHEFEAVGLGSYEAKVLLSLMRLGKADGLQLARMSGIPRTSVYPVLQGLEAKGVAERLPGERPALWASIGRDEVLDRLEARKEEELRRQRDRMGRLREVVAQAVPEGPALPVPCVRLIPSADRTRDAFERLFESAGSEVLAFSKAPYSWQSGEVNQVVVAAVKRGVSTRAIYEAPLLGNDEAFRRETEAYIAAGVEARVVDELPIKLVIADREQALIAITGPVVSEVGYPTNLLVEHSGFAELMADAFEQRWAAARPYRPTGGTDETGVKRKPPAGDAV